MTWYKFPGGRVLHAIREPEGYITENTLITSACGSVDGISKALVRPYKVFPHCKRCESMAVPEWDDVRGTAPDATGNLSREEFVRKMRNEEWEIAL